MRALEKAAISAGVWAFAHLASIPNSATAADLRYSLPFSANQSSLAIQHEANEQFATSNFIPGFRKDYFLRWEKYGLAIGLDVLEKGFVFEPCPNCNIGQLNSQIEFKVRIDLLPHATFLASISHVVPSHLLLESNRYGLSASVGVDVAISRKSCLQIGYRWTEQRNEMFATAPENNFVWARISWWPEWLFPSDGIDDLPGHYAPSLHCNQIGR